MLVKDKKDVFIERENVKPDFYPHLQRYVDAAHESFWKPDDFKYKKDTYDYKNNLTDFERQVVCRSSLGISLVENKVKTFYAHLDMRMPHPEIADVAHTVASQEVIHKLSYEKILILLGLEDEFRGIKDIPCMQGRIDYLTKYSSGLKMVSDKEFLKSLILFTLLVENSSLFSQFLILSSFYKYTNRLENFSGVVTSTSKEENLHAQFGAELVKIIKEENPEWFDRELEDKIRGNVRDAYEAELGLLDWIYEGGDLPFMPKVNVQEYLKDRFNKGLNLIGYADEYDINNTLLEVSDYFETMTENTIGFDFFNTVSSDYSNTKVDMSSDWDF